MEWLPTVRFVMECTGWAVWVTWLALAVLMFLAFTFVSNDDL